MEARPKSLMMNPPKFEKKDILLLTVVAMAVIMVTAMIFGQWNYAANVALDDVALLRRHLIEATHKYESFVKVCLVDQGFTDEILDSKILEHEIDIACSELIQLNGDGNRLEVTIEGKKYSCVGFNPLGKYESRKNFLGANYVNKHIDSGSDSLASYETRLSGFTSDVKYKEIGDAIMLTRENLLHLRSIRENKEEAKILRECETDAGNTSTQAWLCAHVLLYQLPLSKDCYRRDTIDASYRTLIETFEKGNVTQPEEEAKLTVFNGCRDLYNNKFKVLKNAKIDYNGEREKRMDDLKHKRVYSGICSSQ